MDRGTRSLRTAVPRSSALQVTTQLLDLHLWSSRFSSVVASRSRRWPARTHTRRPLVRSLGRGNRSLVDGELLAQGEVSEGELAMTAEEERQKPEDVE